jgi:hypothetical protein
MIDDITQQMRDSIPHQSSPKLAEMVVAYRYLGLYEEISILAMEELGKRRVAGESFEFEKYIDEKIASLPVMKLKKNDISSFFSRVGDLVKKVSK